MLVAVLLLVCAGASAQKATLEQEVAGLKNVVATLGRQLILQQLAVEERIRSEGDSGLKTSRLGRIGSRPYHANTISGTRVASIHDHSNNMRTVGMGEFVAVINGVEFRTRHNDYRLRMKSRTSGAYGATEDVPFPDVPPAVLAKTTPEEQIEEMREWFKAWRDQDYSTRDYRQYFKPTLCYMEGAWTQKSATIEEPFFSDRHFVDASSWFDLQEKIRFTSYSGRKSQLENYAYLPSKIMGLKNQTIPIVAQWNYKILCHPLKQDVPLKNLRVIDDIASRAAYRRTMKSQESSRAARFQIDPQDKGWKDESTSGRPTFLDALMHEIPGYNNYPANLTDNLNGLSATQMDDSHLNAGYYHRVYKILKKDAMGVQVNRRGFTDSSAFMAMTTQDKVAGLSMKSCSGRGRARKCSSQEQKWTWAVPLELIYLNPLYKWNPYNIEMKGNANAQAGKTVYGPTRARNGRPDPATAYDGVNDKTYYITPATFFSGREQNRDKADTTRGNVGVLDRKGVMKLTKASGTRIVLPNIAGVGTLRTRYPIMPLHHEGSTIMKHVQAIQDMVTLQTKYPHMFRDKPAAGAGNGNTGTTAPDVEFTMTTSVRDPPGMHTHHLVVPADKVKDMILTGATYTGLTDQAAGHNHELTIKYMKGRTSDPFVVVKCDGGNPECWDKHPATLSMTQARAKRDVEYYEEELDEDLPGDFL